MAEIAAVLGVLLVARTAPGECDGLDDILDEWDGELTVLMHKRINRHIENQRSDGRDPAQSRRVVDQIGRDRAA